MVSASSFNSIDKGIFSQPGTSYQPRTAYIPIGLIENEFLETLIKKGDSVKEGQVVAKGRNFNVHSSVPGKVENVFQGQFPNGKQGLCAEISLSGSFSFTGKKEVKTEWKNYDVSTLAYLLKDAGIINTFKKPEPIFSQIKKISDKENSMLVVRLFDEDPSVLTDTFIANYFFESIVEGAAIVAKAAGTKTVIFAFGNANTQEKNTQAFKEKIASFFEKSIRTEIVFSNTKKYPCGTMHNLVSDVKKQLRDEHFKNLGRNDLFIDSTTLLNCFKAVCYGQPVIDNYVYITGDCLNGAAIMKVKSGTPLKNLIDYCGGLKRKIAKIIINGTVLGTAVNSLDIPVFQTVKSVEFIPENEIRIQHTETCVRCGSCRKICPVQLWPGNLYRISRMNENENTLLNTKEITESAFLCTECGLCNAVCPSRIPLSQTISLIKEKLNEQN